MAASASTRVKTTTVMSKFMKLPRGNSVSYTTFFKWNTIINTQVVDSAVVKVCAQLVQNMLTKSSEMPEGLL